jgi:hypothetical protein
MLLGVGPCRWEMALGRMDKKKDPDSPASTRNSTTRQRGMEAGSSWLPVGAENT